jgi:Caspase domain
MPGTVHALLVGVNDYRGKLTALSGCVDDIEGFETFLRGRVEQGSLRVLKLLDQDATRQRIIDAFSSYLGEARPGDTVVFYFAGHGSWEVVEERFWFLEPSGKNQTLVCADSRRPGVPDLADKELSNLIDQVAAKGPHVVVLLDCCHSGGGTRDPSALPEDVRVRQAPPVEQPRALDTYVPSVREAAQRAAGGQPTPSLRPDSAARGAAMASITAAGARHVAISACEANQLSKEVPVDGRYRGVFSAGLQQALAVLGPDATYRELLGAVANRVRNRVADQDPVGYATDPDDLDQPMLGGAVRARRSGVTLGYDQGAWWIDAGAVHGIQPPQGEETTVLAVLPRREEGGGDGQPLGRIRVVEVESTRSRVEPGAGWDPDPGEPYPAVVVDVPLARSTVELRGDAGGVALVRAALRGSPHVREVTGAESDDSQRFVVLADAGQLVVARADATPLTSPVEATEDGAARVVRRLEHLARWHLVKSLDNPTSTIAGQVELEIVEAQKGERAPRPGERERLAPDASGDIRLQYRKTADGWEKPYVFVYLHNRSDRDLYCTLLDLTDRFRCHSRLFPVDRIPAGKTAVAFEGRPVDVSVPQERIDAGGTQVRDWLKLVASEERFEPDAYALPNLDGVITARSAGTRGVRSALDRIGDRVVTRDAGDEEPVGAPEWTTAMVSLVTERPADGVEVPATGEVSLDNGTTEVVTIEGHSGLAGARAVLGTTEQAARALQVRDVAPPLPAQDPELVVPVSFSGARATEGALDHLVLRGDIAHDEVTREQPLRLRLHVPVDDDDLVLAVAREDDLFLPLGVGTRRRGAVELDLQRLPAGVPENQATRGLGRSLHIFFQKLAGRRLGIDSGWPRLSLARTTASPDPGGRPAVDLDHDPARVEAAVSRAGRVLLVIHGIFGDSRTMLPALHDTLGDSYDAMLAFDYDCIGTSIEDNAAALAERLARAGVGPADGPRLDVVAHSVGALIARWWLERDEGSRVVRRAVLAGVPNGGTPWATVQGWATTGLALGLNSLTAVAWPAAVLGWLVSAVERADQGIDQLEPRAPALRQLAAGGRPSVPYTVLVGDASVPAGALAEGDESRQGRLLNRLGRGAAALAFLRQPNDLVVGTASMRAFPDGLTPAPAFVEVGCDHLTYFDHADALGAITAALTEDG